MIKIEINDRTLAVLINGARTICPKRHSGGSRQSCSNGKEVALGHSLLNRQTEYYLFFIEKVKKAFYLYYYEK